MHQLSWKIYNKTGFPLWFNTCLLTIGHDAHNAQFSKWICNVSHQLTSKYYGIIWTNVSQIDVFRMVCVPGIPAVLNPHCSKSPLTTVRNANQNFMYQWVFKTMGTEERNTRQTSVHADQITSSYSLSCACGEI